jgi:hypothetical protein
LRSSIVKRLTGPKRNGAGSPGAARSLDLFSWYAANFGLASWFGIWLSVIAVLIGAENDAKMEHQTGDTTTGCAEADGRAVPA